MAFKFIVFAALVAVARGSVVGAPVAVAARISDETFDLNPQYSFSYDVQDSLTGDFKSQTESRNGDLVQGQYSLIEPDGTRRIVDYAADSISGFNAVVRKEPLVLPAPTKIIAEPLVTAPIVSKARTASLIAKTAPLTAKPIATEVVAAPVVARTITAPLLARSASIVAAPASVFAARNPFLAAYSTLPAPLTYAYV